MSRPVISLVTPCRNAVKWLPDCLASVAMQSYRQVDHIVVDAASTDGTVELLRRHSGLRWVSEPDDGQSSAILKGFGLATGEVLGWLNADDALMPDALARVAEAFEQNPGAGLVYGDSLVVEHGQQRTVRPPQPLTVASFDVSNPLPQPSCFFTRDAYEQVGGLDADLHLAMDLDLWLRLLGAEVQAVYVPLPLSRIIVHPEAKTRAVEAERWFEEFGRARQRSHRHEAAALSFGRCAALRAVASSDTSVEAIAAQLRRLPVDLRDRRQRRAAWAGARLQAAISLPGPAPARLRHLVAAAPWRHRATRAEIIGAAASRLRRAAGGGS